ncbi:MAG: hypothetical protein ACAH80_18700 [Alphaproteobacteria bacterium]
MTGLGRIADFLVTLMLAVIVAGYCVVIFAVGASVVLGVVFILALLFSMFWLLDFFGRMGP